MKIFNKKVKNEDILNQIDKVIDKINKLEVKIKDTNAERERVLEDIAFNAKREKIKEYEDIITRIKNESNCRQIIIDQQQETIEKLRTTNQELCDKAGSVAKENDKLKAENEDLKKKVKDLEKRVEDYDKRGIKVPEKVPGSTMPRKGQRLKETVRPVKVEG